MSDDNAKPAQPAPMLAEGVLSNEARAALAAEPCGTITAQPAPICLHHPLAVCPDCKPSPAVTATDVARLVVEARRIAGVGFGYDLTNSDRDTLKALADALSAPAVTAPQGVKPLDLSNLLKHAFISGRVSMGASAASHSDAWVEYDPTESAAYKRIRAALAPAQPAPQGVDAEPWGWWLRDKTTNGLGFMVRNRDRLSIAQPPEEWDVTPLYAAPAQPADTCGCAMKSPAQPAPRTVAAPSQPVRVCPICDIADCAKHRDKPAPDWPRPCPAGNTASDDCCGGYCAMQGENGPQAAPNRFWLGRDYRYAGDPWTRPASAFGSDENEVAEYIRLDQTLLAALPEVRAMIDAERERCARICRMQAETLPLAMHEGALACERAIRKGAEK